MCVHVDRAAGSHRNYCHIVGLAVAGGVHRLGPWVIGGALVLLLAVAVVSLRRERRPFPLLAAATAVFAATWLATVAVR